MKQYKLVNNIFGWLAFVFGAVVYGSTMESSGSFWDCGEFISGCLKLQVVHPPGAPFFLMLGRIFTLFAGDLSQVAKTVNFMSALSTAGAVMFTFWTVTALARKMVMKDGQYTTGRIMTVIGAGVLAAACCTFVDSLWFSAVEGEVYALSQFFMSFIAWAIMKWDADDSPYADHWLVLIAYMTGLSIGVHLLSLLALPFIALVYYYKRFKTTLSGWIIAAGAGMLILGLYMKFIISFTQSYLAGMDLFFVNSLNLPFNSGVVFGVLLLAAVLFFLVRYTHTGKANDFNIALGIAIFYVVAGFIISDSWTARFIRFIFIAGLFAAKHYGYEGRRLLNVAVLAVAFSYIGYMSYLMVPIRAIANPPINMNRPTDPFTIKSYVDREQYGDRPLLRGPDYTITSNDIIDYVKTGDRWTKDEKSGKYVYAGPKQDYKYRDDVQMLFPRMGFWQEEQKKSGYRAWLNPDYNVVNLETREVVKTFPYNALKQANDYVASLNQQAGGNLYHVKDVITFGDNLRYFFKYQIGYMYFRYFMWNFSGRQNDIQGTYGNDDGRWISGIPFIDNSGMFFTPDAPQENLSKSMRENKARNKFYMIPFVIGFIGLIFTLFKDERTFWVIMVLFVTTGLFQIVYQNEPPIEPRERDYAIAGSFLTFTFWIGFGFIAIVDFLKKRLPEVPSAALAFVLCASAPVLMGFQGWDDHNRSGRYTARDFAICYLESCAPNAILFTQGDNDTYPLWYAQEVEGVRPDIRVINLSLLGVDWYIKQLHYKTNDAAPLKLSFTPEQYEGNKRDVVYYKNDPRIREGVFMDLKKVMQFVASEDARDKTPLRQGRELENYLPTRNFQMVIDSNKVRDMNMVSADEFDQVVPVMQWSIRNSALMKNDLMTLDIVANNLMERPIYFAVSVSPETYMGLEKYFQLEGLTYRVVPKVNTGNSSYGAPVRTDAMYENMMKKFKFGGITENPNIYLDENVLRMTVNIRGNFGRLAEALIAKGEKEKAAAVIDYSLASMPAPVVPHSVFNFSYPEVYYQAGQKDKAKKLLNEMLAKATDELDYYKFAYRHALEDARSAGDMAYLAQLQQGGYMERREIREQMYIMQELFMTAEKYDEAEFAEKIKKTFADYRMSFTQGQPQQLR